MKLYRVIVPVRGIDRAAAVYSRLLRMPGDRVSPGRHYFDCGGTILACYDPEADGDGEQGGWHHHPNQYVYFAVNDLEGAYRRAQEVGCRIVDGGIQHMPWGERMFWAVDPFDNPISFVDEKTVFTGRPRADAHQRKEDPS
jgi:predicted enzyme related to lactoylglutathione lyase